MTKKAKWIKLGECAVDSGQLIIADPCYVLPSKEEDKVKTGTHENGEMYTYQDIIDVQQKDNWVKNHHEIVFSGIAGTGVRFNSGLGDGCYPVYAKVEEVPNWGKRITKVVIDTIGSNELLKDISPEDLGKIGGEVKKK